MWQLCNHHDNDNGNDDQNDDEVDNSNNSYQNLVIDMHTNVYVTTKSNGSETDSSAGATSSGADDETGTANRIYGTTMNQVQLQNSRSNKNVTIQVSYDINPDPIHYVDCKVGAKQQPILDGCKYKFSFILQFNFRILVLLGINQTSIFCNEFFFVAFVNRLPVKWNNYIWSASQVCKW